jgi:hypothetical protein
VLLRLAYLGVTNAFAVLRLLPMSDRDKDVEILALRHQITVLERQLGKEKVRFDGTDRAVYCRSRGSGSCSSGEGWAESASFEHGHISMHNSKIAMPGRRRPA